MKPIIRWHKILWAKHLGKAVRNEDIKIKAVRPYRGLPYLSLTWVLNNGSETNIEIKRVYSSLYIGDRRIAEFNVHSPIQKRVDASNRQQYLTVFPQRFLGKGHRATIEFNFQPSLDFWILSQDELSSAVLLDGMVDIYAHGAAVSIPLIGSQKIDEVSEGANIYQQIIRERLSPLVR